MPLTSRPNGYLEHKLRNEKEEPLRPAEPVKGVLSFWYEWVQRTMREMSQIVDGRRGRR
jgi:hypothetical protein